MKFLESSMRILVDHKAQLSNAPRQIDSLVTRELTLKNPAYSEATRYGRWTGGRPPYIRYYQRTESGLILPRGYTQQLIALCNRHGVSHQLDDYRRTLPPVEFEFHGELRPFQESALADIRAHDFGTLQAPTGSGKTVIGLAAIAARKQPTLIIVHTKELLYQWRERAVQFLDLEENEIGLIGDGHKMIGDRLTIGIVNSVYKMAHEIRDRIGFLIVDECHRTPSRTFTEAVSAFDCRFMLGLSATPFRRDGLTELIYWHLGDLVHEIKKKDLIETGDILRAEVVIRETQFRTHLNPSKQYSQMLSELAQDQARNRLIVQDVTQAARNGGGTCLVLSDRKSHCEALSELLSGYGIEAPILTGDTPGKERESIVERLNEGRAKVVCATGQLIGEGFDCKGLQTLFLATPIRFSGRVIQYLGRVLRPAPWKDRAKIFDYNDVNIGVLAASARARMRVYHGA